MYTHNTILPPTPPAYPQAAQAPGWLALLRSATDDDNTSNLDSSDAKQQQQQQPQKLSVLRQQLSSVKPETEEYGISSFVYRARR